MSASDVLGDTSHLTRQSIPFSGVITIKGTSGVFCHPLSKFAGLSSYIPAFAKVTLVGSLICTVEGPVAADKALTARVAVIPTNAWSSDSKPTTKAHVLQLPGNVYLASSVYTTSPTATLEFGPEVTHQLKPLPVSGSPPTVVGWYELLGGAKDSEVNVQIRGEITVSGVGFMKTW
jgi:hypothetical protein